MLCVDLDRCNGDGESLLEFLSMVHVSNSLAWLHCVEDFARTQQTGSVSTFQIFVGGELLITADASEAVAVVSVVGERSATKRCF